MPQLDFIFQVREKSLNFEINCVLITFGPPYTIYNPLGVLYHVDTAEVNPLVKFLLGNSHKLLKKINSVVMFSRIIKYVLDRSSTKMSEEGHLKFLFTWWLDVQNYQIEIHQYHWYTNSYIMIYLSSIPNLQ